MFTLSRDRGTPVYLQIQEQVERRIASGALKPGDALPSVRALATELRVNPNTIVRAYRELEFKRLLESRHGEGTFVAAGAVAAAPADTLLAERAAAYVRAARELGANRKQALAAVDSHWKDEEEGHEDRTAVLRSGELPARQEARPRELLARAPRR